MVLVANRQCSDCRYLKYQFPERWQRQRTGPIVVPRGADESAGGSPSRPSNMVVQVWLSCLFVVFFIDIAVSARCDHHVDLV